ncbi:MAG: UDP-galactopyranose mutase [Clostridiaceae bacterium]|nr:UDP-galactopyranose mutase [Clostridiaceae bacterium]
MTKKVLIIGAGLAGATAARLLAERDFAVDILEQRPQVGGNCYDEPMPDCGLTIHRYGPHIFHTNNQAVWLFCNRFSSFRFYQHRVLSYVDGQMIPFPINRDTLCQLYGENLSIRDIGEFLEREVARSSFNTPPKNFRDVVVSQVGEFLYEKFFHNYTLKQWETDPRELSAEVAGRIPVRQNRDTRYFTDRYQGLPEQGYTRMILNMLDHPAINLHLSTDYFDDRTSWDQADYDLTVYTGQLDTYFQFDYGRLTYRSVDFEFRVFPINQYQPAAVVNYPNDYDFTRITEFKHMTGETGDSTVICCEYPAKNGVPSYVVLTPENLGKRQAYLDHVSELETAGRHLFVGRLAEYRYYNMDQVIASVMDKLDNWFAFCEAKA